MCSDSLDQDTWSPPVPPLCSPKAHRVEVSVIPRPRPSPVRPRIDPWSFISAGGAGRGGGRPPPDPLGPRPSPANPFTDLDPFPSLDSDPFAREVDPCWTPSLPSHFDPFFAPVRTSRSAPCSAHGSPSLSALRVPPLSLADPAHVDLGGRGGGSPPLHTKDNKRQRRQQIVGLEPWTSPTLLRNDRF
ncbi:hypothetical protein MATL_G00055370 [Megalops atlanticus]|uniref:Uncharacterized protein n=1 Tax=Megalops atlanticus TaxID=7932 RepID=A0A9D3TB89_MEGAT|nr:hypothetical protein MATL_G00055370 [Megalops atlanticus]